MTTRKKTTTTDVDPKDVTGAQADVAAENGAGEQVEFPLSLIHI